MTIHLRQVALVSDALPTAIDDLRAILCLEQSFIDDGVAQWGLENTLLAVGTDFIEVVAPTKEGTAAGRYLERRQGAGGYMVICQADSAATQAEVVARAEQQQVRIAFQRQSPQWHIVQLHPADMRASFLEVDSDAVNDFTGNWHPAGGTGWEGSVNRSRIQALVGVELQGPEPLPLAEHWGRVMGLAVQESQGQPYLALNNARIRFVPATDGRGPGLSGVDLLVNDLDSVLSSARQRNCYVSDAELLICGTRFYLQQ